MALATYDEITVAIVIEANITRVSFEKLTIEQRLYLISKHLGDTASKIYEAGFTKQVIAITEDVKQGVFSYTFKYITESTDVFTSISAILNNELYGIYNTKTRYFMLLETYKSLMNHIDKTHLVDNILDRATATIKSTRVSVPSIGNTFISISSVEIREILDRFTESIITNNAAIDETVLTESLLLSLLDVKFEKEANIILNNFNNLSDTLTVLGDNLVKEAFITYSDNVVANGLAFDIKEGTASEIKLYNDYGHNEYTDTILTSDTHLVEVNISEYDSGSLLIFFGGTLLYNDTPTKGTLSFSDATPGSSKHTSLVIQSEDFKGSIGNVSVRKITS